MESNFSLSDIKSVLGDNDLGGNGFLWLILLFLFLGGGGASFGGGRADYATQADLASALGAQTSALNQQQILLSSANNNYETARQIDTLSVNAIQGFNQITQAINSGFAQQGAALAQLSYQMDQCCCKLQTQMLQDRLQDTQFALNAAQNQISNANQSQYLLTQLGKYTPGAATT